MNVVTNPKKPARLSSAPIGTHGQSMVETVIILPLLVTIFLGLYYLKDLVDTRTRAVQAARYLTWEAVWNARENNASRAIKDDETLTQELRNFGLGRGLVTAEGAAGDKGKQLLGDYAAAFTGSGLTADVPELIAGFFPGDGSLTSSLNGTLNDIVRALGPLQSALGTGAYPVHDFFAGTTDWADEAKASVYTARVAYRVTGTSVFRFLGDTNIRMSSSILSHPYNVKRVKKTEDGDKKEYEEMFGTGAPFDCSAQANGRVFGLWLFPSGDFVPGSNGVASGFGSILGGGKCFLEQIGDIFNKLSQWGLGDLGFKLPDGTLKEFPELRE